jgi:cytidine deaminase
VSEAETHIRQIAIVINEPDVGMPCGACRQRIFEFATLDTVVHVGNTTGIKNSFSIDELLPRAFGKHNLINFSI